MDCQYEKVFKRVNGTDKIIEAECEKIACTPEEMKELITKIADRLRRIRDAK